MNIFVIVVFASVMALDIVIISRAVSRIRVNRSLGMQVRHVERPLVETAPLSKRDLDVVPGYRWLEPHVRDRRARSERRSA